MCPLPAVTRVHRQLLLSHGVFSPWCWRPQRQDTSRVCTSRDTHRSASTTGTGEARANNGKLARVFVTATALHKRAPSPPRNAHRVYRYRRTGRCPQMMHGVVDDIVHIQQQIARLSHISDGIKWTLDWSHQFALVREKRRVSTKIHLEDNWWGHLFECCDWSRGTIHGAGTTRTLTVWSLSQDITRHWTV